MKKKVIMATAGSLVVMGLLASAAVIYGKPGPREVTQRWIELCNDRESPDHEIRELFVIKGDRSIDIDMERVQGMGYDIVDVNEKGDKCVVTLQMGEGGMWGLYERKVTLVRRDRGWLIDEVGKRKTIKKNDPRAIMNEGFKSGSL
jgi:hypothetical protein